MMKFRINKFFTWPAFLAICIMLILSCKKEYKNDINLPRLFTPTAFSAISGETQVVLSWPASLFSQGKGVTYTVEVSQDSTFQGSIDYTAQTDSTAIIITDSDLGIKVKYFGRVKANATGTSQESDWVYGEESFQITGEQIFLPIQSTDIIDIAVILKWRTTPGLTKIVMTPDGGSSFDVMLDASDIAAEQKTVSGLMPSTTYKAEIFAGTKIKGFVTFTTQATVSGNNVVDLRSINGDSQVLYDTLPTLADGSIVLLQRGMTYDIPSSYTFDRSVTIMSGLGFGKQAVLSLANNFDAQGNIDSLNFYDLTIAANGASYFMNVGKVVTIGRINIEDCVTQGEYSNSFIRLKTSGDLISKLYINNCIIDSVGVISKYAVLYANASSNAKIDDIEIHNSTFNYIYYFVRQDGISASSLTIDNCTFNDFINQGGYFVNYSGSFPTTFVISNVIFGRVNDPMSSNWIKSTGSQVLVNTYATSDCVFSANGLVGTIAYPGASTDLFADPDNSDFTIKDGGFAGKNNAGDPRWR